MSTDQLTIAIAKMATDSGYLSYGAIAWDALSSGQREVLVHHLFQGPVWDGNQICKNDRDLLIRHGLAVRCCFRGEGGYTAATPLGQAVFEQGGGAAIEKRPGSPS